MTDLPCATKQDSVDPKGWDSYWERKGSKPATDLAYDLIAEFYRKVIIRPILNHFVRRYFSPGDLALHAGCGSGQVDQDIREYVSITALDISMNALVLYRSFNKGYCRFLRGSIFLIPIGNETVDGFYNLGVMEHFTQREIQQVLGEFHRVLKPGGKLLIF